MEKLYGFGSSVKNWVIKWRYALVMLLILWLAMWLIMAMPVLSRRVVKNVQRETEKDLRSSAKEVKRHEDSIKILIIERNEKTILVDSLTDAELQQRIWDAFEK
jgi:membrane-anchored glycerophosphoryl diester phosphodiesterase (GDPDase)